MQTREFKKNMEILFTWRNRKSSGEEEDMLDIRILQTREGGEEEQESLRLAHPGLARDLFRQFVHPDDPVSPEAKAGFYGHFHAALSLTSSST